MEFIHDDFLLQAESSATLAQLRHTRPDPPLCFADGREYLGRRLG
jgi:hypothetical protein